MPRSTRLVALVTIFVIGLAAIGVQSRANAQDATPAADMMMEGLTFTPLGFASNVTLPSPADLTVARAEFAPGTGFPIDASDPEGAIVIVESGAITIRVEEEAWTISRGAALAQAMSTPEAMPDMSGVFEEVAMGTEGTLQAGDVAYIPGNRSGEVRNTGQEPASVLLVLTAPTGMSSDQATPSA